MSEVLISGDAVQSSSSEWPPSDQELSTAEEPIWDLRPSRVASHPLASSRSGSCAVDPAPPSTILPGQLWLIEMATSDNARSALEIVAIATANVVIYERALAPVVAQYLRLGGYAEPVSTSGVQPDQTLDRCFQFARDGWSVAWLVEPGSLRSGRAEQVCGLSARLTAANPSTIWSVFRLAESHTDTWRDTGADRAALTGLVPEHLRAARLGMVVDAGTSNGPAPPISAASSNGLAG